MAAKKPRLITDDTEPEVEEPVVLGAFARIKREAAQIREKSDTPRELTPYVIDDVEPPIVIQPMSTVEQQIVMAEITEPDGSIHARHIRTALQMTCGAEWPRVWELIRGEHDSVLFAFLNEIRRHFNSQPGVGAGDVPGKSPA